MIDQHADLKSIVAMQQGTKPDRPTLTMVDTGSSRAWPLTGPSLAASVGWMLVGVAAGAFALLCFVCLPCSGGGVLACISAQCAWTAIRRGWRVHSCITSWLDDVDAVDDPDGPPAA